MPQGPYKKTMCRLCEQRRHGHTNGPPDIVIQQFAPEQHQILPRDQPRGRNAPDQEMRIEYSTQLRAAIGAVYSTAILGPTRHMITTIGAGLMIITGPSAHTLLCPVQPHDMIAYLVIYYVLRAVYVYLNYNTSRWRVLRIFVGFPKYT